MKSQIRGDYIFLKPKDGNWELKAAAEWEIRLCVLTSRSTLTWFYFPWGEVCLLAQTSEMQLLMSGHSLTVDITQKLHQLNLGEAYLPKPFRDMLSVYSGEKTRWVIPRHGKVSLAGCQCPNLFRAQLTWAYLTAHSSEPPVFLGCNQEGEVEIFMKYSLAF